MAANHWRTVLKRLNPGQLYAEDIGPAGSKVDIEIRESGVMDVRGQDGVKKMPWIGTGKPGGKKLGCNVTNCKALETIAGSADWAHWRGWITLVVVRTKYTDSQTKERFETDAIRIAPQRPRRERSTGPESERTGLTPEEQAEILRKEAEAKP